jgi:hypothetical protein
MPDIDGELPIPLLTAIGRVATTSSQLEAALRRVVAELVGGDDAGWIIFEGQSVDWLIQNGLAVLGQHAEGSDGTMLSYGAPGNKLRELFREADKLKGDRNTIVHGDWRTDCVGVAINEPEFCRPRSPETLRAEHVFHVVRSRYRKGFEEQAWSIDDIEAVAATAATLAWEISGTYREAVDSRYELFKAKYASQDE